MMKQRWIFLGSLTASAALLFAGGAALAAAPGHGGGGHAGGGHAGGAHIGGAHATVVHAGGGHATVVHAGGVHTGGAYHYGGSGGHYGNYGGHYGGHYGYGGSVGIYLGGYGYGGYGYGGGYYAAPYVAGVYSYPVYQPVPVVTGVAVPYSVPSYAAPAVPMTPAQVPSTPNTGGAPDDPVAHLQIKLPPDAELWIEGEKTKQTGETREFSSPALPSGRTFVYEMKARWTEGGKEVVKTKRVPVTAGAWLGVDFSRPDESLVLPKPGTP